MVIKVADVVDSASTGDQGYALYLVLRSAMSESDTVVLSFDGIQVATSSFVNAAFVELLGAYSFAYIRSRLSIVKSSKQINDLIKARLSRESLKAIA